MKKTLVPMVAAFALCAMTGVLLTDSASAQQARTANDAAGSRDATQRGAHMPSPAEMAARHKQMCQDGYAHQVGELAYLEAELSLTATQQPLFDRWKTVKLDIAKRGEADCATRELPMRDAKTMPTPLDGMAREEDMLKRRLADLDAERPVLAAFYNTLNTTQKAEFAHPGDAMPGMMGRRMRGRMFAQHGGPDDGHMDGHRMDDHRSPPAAAEPPPPPQ